MSDFDFDAMFSATEIHTDADGRHWDGGGREYRLLVVDGEATFVPLDDAR